MPHSDEKVENERTYAMALASVMATIAAISFGVLTAVGLNSPRFLSHVFVAAAVIATTGVALAMDSVLDNYDNPRVFGLVGYEAKDRVRIVGGAYVVFTLLMVALLLGVFYLQHHRTQMQLGTFSKKLSVVYAVLAVSSAAALITKMFTNKPVWPLWVLLALVFVTWVIPVGACIHERFKITSTEQPGNMEVGERMPTDGRGQILLTPVTPVDSNGQLDFTPVTGD